MAAPQQLSEDAVRSRTRSGLSPSCHPAFAPRGGARPPGHADGLFQAAEHDMRAQQQQGDVVVHARFFKVLVNNDAGDALYLQGWAL